MKIRDSAVLLLSLGLAFAPLRVSAQGAAAPAGDEKAANLKRAEELYRNGERLYTEGSYESAILAFQESYELSKEPQLLYNIGNAYERLGDFANSRRYLDQYRAFAPEKEREALSRRIQALDQRQKEKEQKEREAAERIRQLLLDSYVERGYKLLDSESGAEESLLWLFRAYEQGSKSAVLPYLLRRAMQPVDARRAAISRGENLTAAAIGPDDHGVVLVAEAGSAWLADADSGQPLRTLGPARSATFCADGQRILLCGDTGVQISEAATGRVLVEIGGSFRRAGFSSDGRSVFAVDTEDTFRHFDADTGRALASIASDERMGLILAIDPTGRLLAVTAGPEYEVELRERESGARSVALVQPPQQVLAATFSADGQRLFVVTKSEVGVVLDVRSGRSLARFDDVVSTELSPATFCPEGRRIVLPGRTGCVTRICDALSGAVLERLRQEDSRLKWLRFSHLLFVS